MAIVMARFETAHASKYLQQVCSHFGKRQPAQWTADEGLIQFVSGTLRLNVRDGALMLTCDAETEDRLAVLAGVLEAHLERVVRGETVTLVWLEEGRPADALNARVRAMSAWGEDADGVRPTIH